MTNKLCVALVAAFFGTLVWAFVDRSLAVDAGYTEADLEFGEYFYDPAATPPLDLFQAPPVSSARTADDGRFQRLTADLERDDSADLVEIHIEYFVYVVAEGDSLWGIERRFGVRFEFIYELNRVEIDRNYSRRCGEPSGMQFASLGHCSTPEATLQKGMVLKIPTDIWIAPIRSYEM